MALPSAITQAMAQNQPLIPSAERSQYSEVKEVWGQSTGSLSEEHPLSSQVASFGVSAGAAFATYKLAPDLLKSFQKNLPMDQNGYDPVSIQKWMLQGSHTNINKVGDVLNLENGKNALKEIRKLTVNSLFDALNLDHSSDANFWYSGLKKIEQSGLNLPIFDNVVKLFTKATYLSDVLSYSVKRKGATTLNISEMNLGGSGRNRTLDLYSKQLGINRTKLDMLDYLVYEDSQVFAGSLQRDGTVKRVGQALSDRARLVNKGAFTEALLTVADPGLGLKDPITGGTYAEKIGGNEGFVLLSKDTIDPAYQKLLDKLGMGSSKKLRRLANATLFSESYVTMGLQRTSKLMSEMFNEVGNFLEYLTPNLKKDVYGSLYKNRLVPRMAHGHGMAMLGRYAALASGIALSLDAVNQVGYSLQNGNAVTKSAAGLAQGAGLTYLGALLGKKAFKNARAGGAVGATLGALGAFGMGPFANGPIPGFANLMARGNEIRSYVGQYSGLSWWRRQVEEVMPGVSNPTTALGIGVAASAVGVTAHRFINKSNIVTRSTRKTFLRTNFGKDSNVTLGEARTQIRERVQKIEIERRKLQKRLPKLNMQSRAAAELMFETEVAGIREFHPRAVGLSEKQVSLMEKEFLSYTEHLEKEGEFGILANRIGEGQDTSKLSALAEKVEDFSYERGRQKIIAETRSMGTLKGIGSRLVAAIKHAPPLKAIAYGALAIGIPTYMLSSGLGIGTVETPDEMRDLNRGKKLEVVRRGQKWEMGQTGYSGDDALYFRPTLTARLTSGAAQAGASGNRGPLEEFILKNFTYKLERENYFTRPAPITGAAFDQIPFIQPFIRPVADLIKAPKLMHVGEWTRIGSDGNPIYLERSTGLDEIPDQSIGGLGMAAPVSPYSTSRMLGRFWQETTSLAGLVGYFGRTAKAAMTGTPNVGDQRQELQSFSESTDMASRFYDLHGGGSFLGIPFTSEVIRRFLFKDEVKEYNPIRNASPSWLPESLKYGNQYASLRGGGGEYRLPGEGYAALHKELKGVNPEDYPLMHRLKILGDLAPYSPQYKGTLRQANLMEAEGDMTQQEIKFLHSQKRMVQQIKNKRDYNGYQFKPSTYDSISGSVSSVDAETMTFTVEGYGGRFGVAGITNNSSALISDFNLGIKEAAKLRQENMAAFTSNIQVGDTLSLDVPASIGHAVDDDGVIRAGIRNNGFNINKEIREEGQFAKDDSPIANYAMTNIAGKMVGGAYEAATHFANRMAQPVEHLMMFGAAPVNKLLPYRDALEDYEARELYGTEMKGWESPISGWIAPAIKSAMHNYLGMDFESPYVSKKRDTEEYFDKLKYLKYQGLANGAEAAGYSGLAGQYSNVMESTAFGSSGFVSDDRIANLLGGRESRFAKGFANEYNPVRQEDIIEALPEHKRHLMKNFYLGKDLDAINRASAAGPMSTTGMNYAQDLTELKSNQGYSDVSGSEQIQSIKQKELANYFQYKSLPKVDWLGFNPAVDLEDVKLKYIESEGMDYHDFGIYPSRASYVSRKPYINEQLVQDVNRLTFENPIQAMGDIAKGYGAYGIGSYNIQGPNRNQSFVNVTVNKDHTINPFE